MESRSEEVNQQEIFLQEPYSDIKEERIVNLLREFDDRVINTTPNWPITTTPLVQKVADFFNLPNKLYLFHALAEYVKKEELFDFPRKDYRGHKQAIHFDQNMARVFMLYGLAMAVDRGRKEQDEPNEYGKITDSVAGLLGEAALGEVIKNRRIIEGQMQEIEQ